MNFYEELVFLELDCADKNDCFKKMFERLLQSGFVRETFLEAIKTREEAFPTGLDLGSCHVAIPHTDPKHVIQPFIAVARLKTPVDWICMATDDEVVHPKFVFMLGFNRSEEQINNLQTLMDNFQNKELMDKLSQAQTSKEFLDILLSIF